MLASDDLLLRNLRALAQVRHTRGDTNPRAPPEPTAPGVLRAAARLETDTDQQGLVLEPKKGQSLASSPLLHASSGFVSVHSAMAHGRPTSSATRAHCQFCLYTKCCGYPHPGR